ncbi:hypothetical protein N0V92_011232 [Colletotrichum tropicale]|nr:hypothetical protein N0V92_011232 [Colletotrichum tropicale]
MERYKKRSLNAKVLCDIYSTLEVGEDTESDRILLMDGEDEDNIEYTVWILRLAFFASNVNASKRKTLRLVWVSPNAADFTLEQKFRLYCKSSDKTFKLSTFDMPFPLDDETFEKQVAYSIADDFGHTSDSTDGQPVFKTTRVLCFWDCSASASRLRPMALYGTLRERVDPDSIEYVHSPNLLVTGDVFPNGKVVCSQDDPRNTVMPDKTRHVVICTDWTQDHFDTETSHVVTKRSPLTGPQLRVQAEVAFSNLEESPEDVTIHAQASLEEIENMPRRVLFEELHMGAFVVMMLSIGPQVGWERVLECFVRDGQLLREAIRRLAVLGFLATDSAAQFGWKANTDLVTKAALILPSVYYDLQTARFLSCIGPGISTIRLRALVNLAAIGLGFMSKVQIPFIEISKSLHKIGTIYGANKDSILKDCAGVSSDVVLQGSLWLALAIYTDLFETLRGDQSVAMDAINRCRGLLIVSKTIFVRIRALEERLVQTLRQIMTLPDLESQDGSTMAELDFDDVSFIQMCLLQAWCCQMVYTSSEGRRMDLLSQITNKSLRLQRLHGHFSEMMGPEDYFLLGLKYSKSEKPIYNMSLTVLIPNRIVKRFLQERGLSFDQLSTKFPLHAESAKD